MAKKKSGLFEEVEAEIVNGAKSYVETKIKRKAIRIGEISILVVLAFFMISIGVANILANLYPILMGGYSYVLLGIVFLLVAMSLKV